MVLRRGRRHPEHLRYGEAVDFWRVNGYEQNRRLRLHAEMRLPGTAELEFHLEPLANGGTHLVQTARFRPKGLLGLAFWYSVWPLHCFVFPRMVHGIKRDAQQLASQ